MPSLPAYSQRHNAVASVTPAEEAAGLGNVQPPVKDEPVKDEEVAE